MTQSCAVVWRCAQHGLGLVAVESTHTENPARSRTPSVRIVVPPFSSFEALVQKEGGISVPADTFHLRVPWTIAGLSGAG